MVSSYLNDLVILDDNVLDLVVSGAYAQTRLWDIPHRAFVKKARALLRRLGCLRYEDSKLRELSQGERQKVMIARALMPDPKLLTLDEPCAGLDLMSRESFISGLEKIAKNNSLLSILYVTHRIDEIPGCFGKALLLKEGKIIASGNIDSVLTGRNISKCFDVQASVKKSNNRFYTIIRK
jgi:iron complex transport system ATP-binding protein